MILAVSAFLVSSLAVAQDTVTVTPVMDGAYGGHVCAGEGSYFEWPTGAEIWGGCANTNADIYPLDFPNGGTLTMTASATGEDCQVGFTAEATAGGGAAYTNASSIVTVSGSTPSEYQLEFDNEEDLGFESLIMSVKTRDCGVNITAMSLEHGPVAQPTPEECEEGIHLEEAFGGAVYDATDCANPTYTFPGTAEGYAGFADKIATEGAYPYSFPYGGSVSFTCSGDSAIKWVFEKDAYPDTEPSIRSEEFSCAGEGSRVAHTWEFGATGENEFNNFLMYVVERDTPVSVTGVAVAAAAPPPPPPPAPAAPATPVPALPFWALLGLAGLVGLFGLRRR